MKNLIITLGILVLPLWFYSQIDTVSVWVNGNCGMCETNIENAAKINGVILADWNIETDSIKLIYNTKQVNQKTIEQAIANIGYETENVKANNEAYINLPECCQYREEEENLHHIILTGKVLEAIKDKKEPLFGANVYWLETTEGITTDFDGNFTIERHQGENTLIVSYVGLSSDTLVITNEKSITVVKSKNASLKSFVVTSRASPTTISQFNTLKIEKMGTKELAKAPCCNLSESFETNPSVDIAYSDAVTGAKQIQMLGLSGPSIQISSGNMPDVRGLSAVQGLIFIPGPWIKNIYLNKGTGSVVNGFESIAGQIDVELRDEDTLVLNAYGNQGGRLEGNATVGYSFNDYLRATTHIHYSERRVKNDQNKDGFLDNPLNTNLYAHNAWKYIGKGGLRFNVGVEGGWQDRIGGQTTFDKDNPLDSSLWGYTGEAKRGKVYAKIGKVYDEHPDKSMGLQISGAYFETTNDFGFNRYNGIQRSFYANYIFQNSINETENNYKIGASYLQDNYTEELSGEFYNRMEQVPGVFTEFTINSIKELTVVAGLRADYHSIYGAFLTPRLHLKYNTGEKGALRFSMGRGQRTANILAENMGMLASSRTITIEGDTSKPNYAYGLRPEIAWNIGGSYTQGFVLAGREMLFTLDLYHTNFTNQIVVDWENPREVSFYNLKGQSFANSIQAQIDAEIILFLDVRLAYRYYDVRTDYQDQGLVDKPYLAKNRAFVNLAYEVEKNWMFDATINWIGEQRLPSTETNPIHLRRANHAPSYFVVSGQITKQFKRLAIYVGVENALNYKQNNPIIDSDNPFGSTFDASMIWGPIFGRNIYGGLRYVI